MFKNPVINILIGILLIVCLFYAVIESAVSSFGKGGILIGGSLASYYVYKIFKDKKSNNGKTN